MSGYTRLPATLKRIEIPVEHIGFAERRIRDHVRYAAARFSAHRSVANEMEELALSCYLQGVNDGVQVARDRPEVMEIFAELDRG